MPCKTKSRENFLRCLHHFVCYSFLCGSFLKEKTRWAQHGTTHTNGTTRRGMWRKLLKLHPNYLILNNDSLSRYSLVLNTPNFDLIIANPSPETVLFYLKGQEKLTP